MTILDTINHEESVLSEGVLDNNIVKTISLSSLSLSNFRNYEYARIEVTPKPVVLIGKNGAGKTNILEAISLLSAGRGLRRAKLSEIDSIQITKLPQPVAQPWAIAANLNGRHGEVKIGTGRDGENLENIDKRIVKIDGKTMRGQADLSRNISLIWLTPQMEQLFSEGTSSGRKFLDRLVFSFDPEHATRINEYDYAMRERNKLLQYNKVNYRAADTSWLSVLEQKMAEKGAAIAVARLSTCEHINYRISASNLSFPKALIDVLGFAENLLKSKKSSIEVENALQNIFADSRKQDSASGRTLVGTHRSELSVIHIEKNMPADRCSMGEQKALMLSIILAQARSGAQFHGVVPIILLDEVAGHLDATKRLELFEEIHNIGAQTWMTGTDTYLFAGLEEKAQFFNIANDSIYPA